MKKRKKKEKERKEQKSKTKKIRGWKEEKIKGENK